MATEIKKFLVSNDLSKIDLEMELTEGESVTDISFWNESTYRDNNTKIDLTSLASSSNIVELNQSNTSVPLFNGIYVLQVTFSNGDVKIVGTMNFTQYYKIQAILISNIDLSCLNCNTNFQNSLLMDMYLQATKNSLILGRFQDAIDNLSKLVITTEGTDCDECHNIEPLVSTAGNVVSVGVLDCQLTQV